MYAAVGNLDGLVQIVDLKSRQVKQKFENHFMPVRALAFTASGQQLISAGEDLHIFVSDVESQQRKHTFVGHGKLITDIACHPINEEIFTTSSLDGTIKIWSMKDQSGPINSIVMGQPVWSVAYN